MGGGLEYILNISLSLIVVLKQALQTPDFGKKLDVVKQRSETLCYSCSDKSRSKKATIQDPGMDL